MEKTKQVLILTGVKNNMNQLKEHTDSFLKGIISLTGLSFRKVQLYARENNPVNILEHPHTLQPNEKQLLKIGQLNELISAYSLLKMCEGENKIGLTSSSKAGEYFVSLLGGKDSWLLLWIIPIMLLKQEQCRKEPLSRQQFFQERY